MNANRHSNYLGHRLGVGLVALVSSFATSFPKSVLAQTAAERVVNGNFDAGMSEPWWGAGSISTQVVDGRFCVDVIGGTLNPWDASVGQNQIAIALGGSYHFEFEAFADPPANITTTIQLSEAPYTSAMYFPVSLGQEPERFVVDFNASLEVQRGQITFQLGGGQDFTFCLDRVSLVETSPGHSTNTGPAIRVNQVGYVPNGPKRATLVTHATVPQPWQLKNSNDAVVASGQTMPFGPDVASGDSVQLIEFSQYHKTGKGYRLQIGELTSYPFDIQSGLYAGLGRDALQFFYHQRSGIPIEAKYVGNQYAHPAGHLGVPPNQGDTKVACFANSCDYSRDVRGGWYDAGDQGKYVVNGGIAVWQLVNAYERAQGCGARSMRDGTGQIPERNNGAPDILDEARWEQEFLLRMQVPEGKPYHGMAFHRVHDDNWTMIPMAPDQDPQLRHIHPPSTAATLNLAATAAQCGRVWQRWDPRFAQRCLSAAERAWAAAIANPDVYTFVPTSGGGDYADENLSDEFYWAAAELFVTTGKKEYREFVVASPHFATKGIPSQGFTWRDTSGLGDLTLAFVPNQLSRQHQNGLRSAIAGHADRLIEMMRIQGYPIPYLPEDRKYWWGSNSQVLNQTILLAAAHDITGERKYSDAAFEAIDYILGRNGMNQSYVTGYGSRFSQNQHHRFWAHQTDATFPRAPNGALAGGPNNFLQDPTAKALLSGCAPHKCYVDDINSYSTNEVAINWNSALVWVAAWLAERG